MKYSRIKISKLLIWLAHRIGGKNNLHLQPCPVCSGTHCIKEARHCPSCTSLIEGASVHKFADAPHMASFACDCGYQWLEIVKGTKEGQCAGTDTDEG